VKKSERKKTEVLLSLRKFHLSLNLILNLFI